MTEPLQSSSEEYADPTTSIHPLILEFPTIAVRGTPARWLHHSQIVTMTPHRHEDSSAEEATSSLGDSTYDFIDDRSVITTDDESQDGMTESTTSSDGHEADQLHNQSYDYERMPNEEFQAQTRNIRFSESSSPHQSPTTPVSTAKGVPPNVQTSMNKDDEGSIIFEEPSVVDLASSRLVEVSHILELLQPTEDPTATFIEKEITITVRQTMASRNLELRSRAYKVLYVGKPAFKDIIIQKLATALATTPPNASLRSSSPRASKFNVVPISSFGDDTSPEVVLIDSSGVELEVEECTQTRVIETSEGSGSLQLSLADGSSVKSTGLGPDFTLSDGWSLPDVAIFFSSDDDDVQVKLTRRFSRLFMRRHSIPSIMITAAPQWGKASESITLDYLTPHICLEDQSNIASRPRVLKRLPIDLNTFLKIDAGQMNRNLACLSNARSVIRKEKHTECIEKRGKGTVGIKGSFDRFIQHWPPFLRTYYGFVQRTFDLPIIWKLIGFLLVGICLARLAAYTGSHLPSSGESTAYPKVSSIPMSSKSSVPMVNPSLPDSASIASYTSSTPAQISPPSSFSTDTDTASFFLDHSMRISDKTDKFTVHLLGDCHVVMRPPQWFTKLRKAPSLSFRISRQDSILEHQVSTLFDGVYALQIPREEAYGILTVDILAHSRPTVKETFEVDFGSSWLKIAAWKRATRALSKIAQNELSQLQTSLSTVYDKARVEISTVVQKNKERMVRQQDRENSTLAHHFKQSVKTRDLVVTQAKDLTRHLLLRFNNGRTIASQQIKSFSKEITRDLTLYTRNRTERFLHRAQFLGKATTGIDVPYLLHELHGFRLPHLRNAQKKALKGWWRIRGLPKQKTVLRMPHETYRSKRTGISGEQA